MHLVEHAPPAPLAAVAAWLHAALLWLMPIDEE